MLGRGKPKGIPERERLTVAVLDLACVLKSDGEGADLVVAVRARIELANRASLFCMAPLVLLAPCTGTALDSGLFSLEFCPVGTHRFTRVFLPPSLTVLAKGYSSHL